MAKNNNNRNKMSGNQKFNAEFASENAGAADNVNSARAANAAARANKANFDTEFASEAANDSSAAAANAAARANRQSSQANSDADDLYNKE